MDRLYLGMYEGIALSLPGSPLEKLKFGAYRQNHAHDHEEHEEEESADEKKLREWIEKMSYLIADDDSQEVQFALRHLDTPPCAMCANSGKMRVEQFGISPDDIGKRYEVYMKASLGALASYGATHPKRSREEESAWKSKQVWGPLGSCIPNLRQQIHQWARFLVPKENSK